MERNLRVLEYYKIIEIIADLASSFIGRDRILSIRPMNSIAEIKLQQDLTAEMTSILITKNRFPFGPLHDLKKEIKMAEIGSSLSIRQLLQVSDSLRTTRNVYYFVTGIEDVTLKYPGVYGIIKTLTPLKKIEDNINNAIIGEDQISDNASPKLRDIRRKAESKQASIRSKLLSYTSSIHMSKYLQDAIVTIRNDRFVIPVKAEHKGMVKGMVHDQSASGATVFIEPMAIVEMNNELRQLRIQEVKEIERILAELTAEVGANGNAIRINFEVLIEIDVILAKAKYAVQINAIKPEISSKRNIVIKGGRHPLINPKEVVPLDIEVGKSFKSLIITGPNTGGKTVTLKTVGLLCLMFQAGIHVPAKHGTTFAVFDYIYADIGDEQSIEQSLSTFSSHMTNIVKILKDADYNTLVLLDELGAGTDPIEGAALAMSILQELYQNDVMTLATTHYSELKHYALSKDGFQNASVEFNVDTLKPTYRLIIGVPGKSNAFEISKILGLGETIINKAKSYLDSTNIEFEDILEKINKNLFEAENDRNEAIQLKIKVQKIKDKLDSKNERIEESRNKIVKKAKEEAKKLLIETKNESEELIRELRGMNKSSRENNQRIEKLRNKLKDQIGNLSETQKSQRNYEHPKNVNIGQQVMIINLDTVGEVASKSDKDGKFYVQAGIMKVKVGLNDVILDKSNQKHEMDLVKSYSNIKRMDIESEIDLRGMNIEEGMMAVDKYLDDAFMAGLEAVQIIHGKGTGVLRKGMKEYLKHHKHVKSQRDGTYREGGIGVTVVELK